MKRSEINNYIDDAKNFFTKMNWKLPKFAFYTPDDWKRIISDPTEKKKHAEILDRGLGWDLSDFGSGDFLKMGLLLFTMRNGTIDGIKNYAEKIMIVRESQITPWHYHWSKAEDIINRGGGNLMIEVYNAAKEDNMKPTDTWKQGKFDLKSEVIFSHDGISETIKAGSKICLLPGDSITIPPRLYHTFYGEAKKGMVMVGEVSRVNDDSMDNRFFDKLSRFPPPVEDVKPNHLRCNEYESFFKN